MSGNLAGALQLLDAVEANARNRAGTRRRPRDSDHHASSQRQPPARGGRLRRRDGAPAGRRVSRPTTRSWAPRSAPSWARSRACSPTAAWSRCSSCPRWSDPEKRALVDVLFKTNASAFMSKPQASVLIGLKAVRLAIEHGNAPKSPYFYGNYGIINNAIGGDLDVSYRFGRLGIDLVDKAGYTEIEGSTHFLFGAFNCHWRRPLSQSLEHLRHAVKAASRDRRLPARGVGGGDRHVLPLLSWREHPGAAGRRARERWSFCAGRENTVAQTLLRVLEQNLRALSGSDGERDRAWTATASTRRRSSTSDQGHPRPPRLLSRAQAAAGVPPPANSSARSSWPRRRCR